MLKKIAAAALCFSVVTFQNCASYEASSDSLYDPDVDAKDIPSLKNCLGTECEEDLEEVALSINNQPPLRLAATDAGFDVGGNCNTGGYSQSRIYYSIKNTAGTVVKAETNGNTACDENGRWSLSVPVPAGFVFTNEHTVTVILRVVELGVEKDNPRLSHKKEIRTSSL